MRRLAALAFLLALLVPAAAPAGTDPDGRYKGTIDDDDTEITATVSRDGRRLTNLRTRVGAFCVGPTLFDNYATTLFVHVPRASIGRSGRFSGTYEPTDETKIEYSGRRRGTRITGGKLRIQVGVCSGQSDWTARKARR